jgi:uncharacterized phage-associated protein
MTTVSAHDVADELRTRLPDVGATKAQKLLYYAQGWHLALFGEPLFEERIEAWAKGPVVGTLWADEKHDRARPKPRPLTDAHLATIDYVVRRYGSLTARELIDLTHAEDPWRDVSLSDEDDSAGPSPEITHDALRSWFLRDDHVRSLTAATERLRARRDVYSFEPADVPGIDDAVARAVRGETVRHDLLRTSPRSSN